MDRDTTVDSIVKALRRVNFQGSIFGQTIAVRLGLSESDIQAIEALVDVGPATAGRLAELMGLTTGAVTRLIDRLEQSGYVRRVPDPADRRRVIIDVVPERIASVESMLANIGKAGSTEIARYTDGQLDLINDFLARMADVTKAEATRLRGTPSGADNEPGAPTENSAALGGLTSARLVFRTGASEVMLRSGRGLAELYKARFEGAVPQVRVRDGTVSIQYRVLPFDWRKRRSDITLNETVAWAIELVGGSSRFTADLSGIDLRSFELTGGASRLLLTLGRPSGVVPVRIVGGAGGFQLQRPAGVSVRLRVVGGAGKVEFDGQRPGTTVGETVLTTPGADEAADRFGIEIIGGVGRVIVREARPR